MQAFGFKNLTHAVVPASFISALPKQDCYDRSTKDSAIDDASASQSSSPLARMINESSELASLGIRFRLSLNKLQLDGLLQSLNCSFPALRKLEICGYFTIDWDGFISQTIPLYHFLKKHAGLHAVIFNWDHSDQSRIASAPNSIFESLLPSLREFGGMQALCIHVVSSPKLSQQIEKLNLIDKKSQKTRNTHQTSMHYLGRSRCCSNFDTSNIPRITLAPKINQ